MYKKLVCLILCIVLTGTTAMTASADRKSDLKEQKAAAEEALDSTYSTLDALQAKQEEIQGQISDYNADIVDLMVQIDQAKADIETTEGLISDKKDEIEVTKGELAEAEETRDDQYSDMKARIKTIYERGGDLGWATVVLSAEDITSLVNKAEYATKLHEFDRDQLAAYVETVEKTKELKAKLEEEKTALDEQKTGLEAQKAGLEESEAELEKKLEEAKAENADYDNQIAEAKEQAEEIVELIYAAQAEIERIEEEERRAAEEAARRAAEEAARQAAAEEAARQAAAEEEARQAAAAESYSDDYDEDYDGGSSGYSGSGSSSDIVAYADRFVGNPYVWGGNSLTNGCDCSHFVYNVLKDTGSYSGGYTTSGGFASLGSSVGSLSDARAGDVIVYSGHVAIYDGNGGIVEAKGSKYGITHDRSADYKSIVAIRRFN